MVWHKLAGVELSTGEIDPHDAGQVAAVSEPTFSRSRGSPARPRPRAGDPGLCQQLAFANRRPAPSSSRASPRDD
jgi:hypothetical protein